MNCKRILAMLLALVFVLSMGACASGGTGTDTNGTSDSTDMQTGAVDDNPPVNKSEVSVIALKGPTGMGMAKLMQDNDAGLTANHYHVNLLGTPTDAAAEIIKGNYDIATVSTNQAAMLYKKTEGDLQIVAVETLGVLYVLENGDTIHSMADLEGKTIYATGQGAVPEYVLTYLLEANNINARVEYLAEHAELATKMAAGSVTIGMLPEPNVTTVLSKNSDVRIALDLTKEWEAVAGENKTLAQGCLVARKGFIEKNPDAFAAFLEEYQASVNYTNQEPAAAAEIIAHYGIVPAAAIAEAAIPNCNITYIDGEEMQTILNNFFQILYTINPSSIGGDVPREEIYYRK